MNDGNNKNVKSSNVNMNNKNNSSNLNLYNDLIILISDVD